MSPLITLTTDFGPGNKGIGVMHAVIGHICPAARVIDLAQDVPGFDIRTGARLLEAIAYVPASAHICVVDPGVGTNRHPIIISTKRGDALVGPDNGVLIPATSFLGGVAKVVEIRNPSWMLPSVSAIFHGRDVFAPAAAHIAAGKDPRDAGPPIDPQSLVSAPYPEARCQNSQIAAEIIDINNFGNVFLNIRAEEIHKLVNLGDSVELSLAKKHLSLPYRRTFSDVPAGTPVIIDDDFGRVEVAVNMGNFAEAKGIDRGLKVVLKKLQMSINESE